MIELLLGGQTRLLSFGNAFREELGKLYASDPLESVALWGEAWKQSTVQAAIDIVYCAMSAHCRLMRIAKDFTIQDVGLWMDELNDSDLAPVVQAFMKSQQDRPILAPVETEVTEEAKKKSAGRKSRTSR